MEKTSLGDRMKGYEQVSKLFLTKKTPVIVRLDGKAFHTYTRGMPKPYFEELHSWMAQATKYLVEDVDTCVLAYTQSDEISLLLKDFTQHKTQSWFDNNLQKIISTTASLLTARFNYLTRLSSSGYFKHELAFFDSRAFNIPEAEVCNYFLWRQQDATRNSINGLGQKYFTQKALNGKNTDQVQHMLITEHGVNWNDVPTWAKRGTCVKRTKTGIILDEEIPIFSEDRNYINELLEREE